ncbi:MAG: hypothetical protein WCD31_00410 [Gillisia sp.]
MAKKLIFTALKFGIGIVIVDLISKQLIFKETFNYQQILRSFIFGVGVGLLYFTSVSNRREKNKTE